MHTPKLHKTQKERSTVIESKYRCTHDRFQRNKTLKWNDTYEIDYYRADLDAYQPGVQQV